MYIISFCVFRLKGSIPKYPRGRVSHSFTLISPTQAFLYGGLSHDGQVLGINIFRKYLTLPASDNLWVEEKCKIFRACSIYIISYYS